LKLSKGSLSLRAWRVKAGLSPNAAAKQIGADRDTYLRWESGEGVPTLRFAVPIEDTAGVAMRSWLEVA
jgi:DNA-binding XRE family transcriptional regulator